jgi:ABC-type nitrate/sulfonate/bicarbonate transport system substrate-binding protein
MEVNPLQEAADWLLENPTETMAVAARLFKVPREKLRWTVSRTASQAAQRPVKHGGQNKILSDSQIMALKQWILLQYKKGLGATRHMTYAAVCYLRRLLQPPSQSWLTKFIKTDL